MLSFVHVFEVGFDQFFIFSLRDINLTLGLLSFRMYVIWRYSVGVGSSTLGLKSECTGLFSNRAPLSVCYAILMSYNNSETAVCGLSSRCRVDVSHN